MSFSSPHHTIHHDPGDPWGRKVLDRAGFKERVRLSRAPFPDRAFTLHERHAEGNGVAVTWSRTGTHAGDMPGFPTSGETMTVTGATVYYFGKGKIAGHGRTADRLGLYRHLQYALPAESPSVLRT